MNKITHIVNLLDKHLKGQLIEQEQTELNNWVDACPENRDLLNAISNKEVFREKLNCYSGINSDRVWELTEQKIHLLTDVD